LNRSATDILSALAELGEAGGYEIQQAVNSKRRWWWQKMGVGRLYYTLGELTMLGVLDSQEFPGTPERNGYGYSKWRIRDHSGGVNNMVE
jgi:DNA-binding PadR family transcriptional regulator